MTSTENTTENTTATDLPPVEHPAWCDRSYCDVKWVQVEACGDQPAGPALDGSHRSSLGAVRVSLAHGVGKLVKESTAILVGLSQYASDPPVVDFTLEVPERYEDGVVEIAAPVEVDQLIEALRTITAPLRQPEPSRAVNTAPCADPMPWVARADITDPVWDEYRGVMVIPTSYSQHQADDAVVQLVRERNGR